MVGAIVVGADDQKLGEGFHTYDGVKHAEAIALEQAGAAARGATLYVSLEPCSHEGRTPACADAVVAAGIRRVVCPTEDLSPRVSGSGFERLRTSGIEVVIAEELGEEARRLNEAFTHHAQTGKPFVTLKTAATLDGKIAAPDDNTGWITSEKARAHVQQVRHNHDAILTGIGTVLADDCLLTDRSGLPRRKPLLRVVVDSLLRLPLESKLVESFNGDLIVASTSSAVPRRLEALQARGVPVMMFDDPRGRVDLRALMGWLGEQEVLSLMIEAGSKLNWAALDNRVVDKTLIYYAPKILGGADSLPLAGGVGRRSRSGAMRLHNLRTFMVGQDEFAVEAYLVHDADRGLS